MTTSWLCLLPRIIPGPQVLLDYSRPTQLPQVPAVVVNLYSGQVRSFLPYLPNTIHQVEKLAPFSFRVWEIKPAVFSDDESFETVRRENTAEASEKPFINQSTSPTSLVSIISFMITLGLFVFVTIIKDGVACLVLVTISFQSSVVCYARWSTPGWERRWRDGDPGNVIIRTREGALILVICSETISRTLYMGSEDFAYCVPAQVAKLATGIGAFLLLVSVCLLSNCQWRSQVAIGVAYVFLTLLYISLPRSARKEYWNKEICEATELFPVGAAQAHQTNPELRASEVEPSYVRTLWYAIRETKKTRWAVVSGAIPDSWRDWLHEAQLNVDNYDWPAVAEHERIVGGREDVYDFPPESDGESESRREASLEIRPVHESLW